MKTSYQSFKILFIAGNVMALILTTVSAGTTDGTGGTDSNPSAVPQGYVPEIYRPTAAFANAQPETAQPNRHRHPAPVPGPVDVFFTPQDENTSTTVIFLYNTSSVDATVPIQTFALNGSQTLSTSVPVPAW